ncbi:MAG: hypothetical protein RL328_502 [Acidobacteriota bacterium]|jgi:hypothetical protein
MNTDELQTLMNELAEERKLREGLEARVNEMTAAAQEAERVASIRGELQRLGVAKVDLAFRAVKEDLKQTTGEQMKEYLAKFVAENPELMPARISGGSGATSSTRGGAPGGGIDLEKIRPGMSAEEMDRVRQEIARVASQTLRGGW